MPISKNQSPRLRTVDKVKPPFPLNQFPPDFGYNLGRDLGAGGTGQARTRVVFDTATIGGVVEGFFKVYQGTDENFVSARLPTGNTLAGAYLQLSANCGDFATDGTFLSAKDHDSTYTTGAHMHGLARRNAFGIGARRKESRRDGGNGTAPDAHLTIATRDRDDRKTRRSVSRKLIIDL